MESTGSLKRVGWMSRDRSFYREIFFVALPVAFQQMINIGVNLMDTVMVGALGETVLSASSLANQYYNLYYILCLGISGGTCVLSSQYWGAGNKPMMRQVWRLSMLLTAGSAVIFSLITLIFPLQIMRIYTNNPVIVEEGAKYLRVTASIFFFHGTSLVMVNLLRTAEVNFLGMPVSCVSFVLNIFFNYAFIYGHFGFPRLEIAGAAVGTLISRLAEFAITFGYLGMRGKRIGFTFRDLIGPLEPELWRSFRRVGIAPIISDSLTVLGDNALSVILGHMSTAVISGQAITLATMRFCTAFIMGLNSASAVLIGHEVGRGTRETVQLKGKTLFVLSIIGGLIGGAIIWVVSPFIVRQYALSPEAVDATMQMMLAMSLLMVFQSAQSVMSKGVLRGGGDTRFLMFADIVFIWLLNVPLGYLSGIVWKWPAFWVFVCLKLDVICKTFLCLWRLLAGKWIRNINIE